MHARLAALGLGIALALTAGCDVAPPYIEATTRLGSTPDTVGPYVVQSVVVGVDGEKVELSYRIDDDRFFIIVPMMRDDDGGDTEVFVGAIPGRPAGTHIEYYVSVRDGDGTRLVDDPEGAGARPYAFDVIAAPGAGE